MDEQHDPFLSVLRKHWGYPGFRGIQRQIIESIAAGHDTLGLMPTGGGKSITFQVPALVMPGVCIVITPLIALMKDQVQALRQHGIMAAAIYSGMQRHEILRVLDNCILGDTRLLYISPERIASPQFQNKLRRIPVSFITVDEAHCISQWGYDFRPSYLHISDIRRQKPGVPVLALTATATPQVVDDIQERLGFSEKRVFSMSFERTNLAYVVRRTNDKQAELEHILQSVPGSAIVYVRSRKRSKDISDLLEAHGFTSTFYHAGLQHSQKDERQKAWHDDRTRVIVATNAFGMGIDKPDVRLVVHMDCPSSPEAYFQEAGRAGRDGQKSYAVLLYNDSDQRKLDKRIADEFPDKKFIAEVYEHLAYFYQIGVGSGCGHVFAFDIDKFCTTFRHFPVHVNSALTILSRAGYIDYDVEPDNSARLMFLLGRNDLYQLDNLAPREDAVIMALLRNYGGLFTDYAYIDEDLIARAAGLTNQQVYLLLKDLGRRHILHFIPQRKTPLITYLRDRVEMERVQLSPEVYEERRQQFARGIEAVLAYATNDSVCRSRQLLRYFGETRSKDCGQCDVCLSDHRDIPAATVDDARRRLIAFLADGQPHHVSELSRFPLPRPLFDEALEWLVSEMYLTQRDGFLMLTPAAQKQLVQDETGRKEDF